MFDRTDAVTTAATAHCPDLVKSIAKFRVVLTSDCIILSVQRIVIFRGAADLYTLRPTNDMAQGLFWFIQ